MFKITFMGAGSTVFCKNVLGDCILTPEFGEFEIALYDIDEERLNDSKRIIDTINKNYNGKAKVKAYLDRKKALKDAKYVVNAVQVGGYKPSTVIDFEIPKKYGLKQTIADTLGIGGIFRALRTIPVLEDFANDMENVCPDALFLNYSNPMAMLTGYMLKHTGIKTVGLCHSVQACVPHLLNELGMQEYNNNVLWEISGINHMAFLLKITDKAGNDLYPEIKRRSLSLEHSEGIKYDRVRHEMMHRFGYYITESSEHNAEYHPYFIKSKYPELIEKFNIPLDEYPRRCIEQIANWKNLREQLISDPHLKHEKSHEYGSLILKAIETDSPFKLYGNVLNKGLITNLPETAVVEIPILVDGNGLTPCYVGKIPEQCAALNMTNINVQELAVKASVEKKKDYIYMAAYMDPHTNSELSMDDIKAMCDELIDAHGDFLPKYK